MYRFQPFPGMSLQIAGTNFEFVSHPLLPYDEEAVFVLEGSTAFVYQLRALDTKQWYALKVFKPAYRGKYIAQISTFLAQHADITAFQAERRSCLTMDNCSRLIQTFPELEYAILMPWAMTPTWTGILLNPEASAGYTFAQARDLALATANTLWNIESYGWAHTDIGGSNLVPSPDRRRIQLLDLEGFYIPGMPLPPKWSRGSPGYQHRHPGSRGQWCPEGDRFAGAVLLTEMLTWWEPRVRAHVDDDAETLFRPDELQVPGTPCWQIVRDVLRALSPNLLQLFDQAWTSNTLADCPTLGNWAMILVSDFS